MSARLVILIVLAAGLAIFLATRTSAPPVEAPTLDDGFSKKQKDEIREATTPLGHRSLPGEEPAEPPDLAVQVEVDTGSGKNRLHFYVTEAHGYYVEEFEVEFFYKPNPDTTIDDSPFTFRQWYYDYVTANETYVSCLEMVSSELQQIDNDMGTSENWGAEIVRHGRARYENPDPLPPIKRVVRCD